MPFLSKTILIVNNNLEERHTYNRYFQEDVLCTYKIVEAKTGAAGLKFFEREHPDLTLLDLNLPDMDGLEFVAQLKKRSDILPPMITLTGGGNEGLAVEAMKAGVKDYLVKGETTADSLRFVVRSVLEQARLERLAQRNEQRFHAAVENMHDCFGIYTTVRDRSARRKPNRHQKIVSFYPDYLNEAACKDSLLFSQDRDNSVLAPTISIDSHKDLFALCCQVVETGKAISTEFNLHSKSQEHTNSKFWEIKIDRLEDGFVAIWRDITDRIQIKQALEQSEIKFRSLVTHAPVGIFQTDPQGDCTYVNPRWLEITGLSQTEAIGQGWSNALHPEDKDRVFAQWYEAARSGKEFASEYRFRSPEGEITWVSGKAVAIYSNCQRCLGYFGMIIDISERKQAEALLQQQQDRLINTNQDLEYTSSLLKKRNRELDEFTYVVSHDLKAPLRAIHNLSEWIEEDLEDKLDEDTKNNFELLKSRVNRMQMFINSLLEYARVGREHTSNETFAVKDLLLDIIDSLAPPPEFAIAIGESMPTFNTQKIALEQVFTNLISNAIKHHHSQTGKIEISATEDQELYYFAVSDDGMGIAPEHQERVFGIFQTLSSRDERENTGIGLSIVKKIVESQGGTIELESQLGRGTTFRFSWRKLE